MKYTNGRHFHAAINCVILVVILSNELLIRMWVAIEEVSFLGCVISSETRPERAPVFGDGSGSHGFSLCPAPACRALSNNRLNLFEIVLVTWFLWA